MCFVDDLLIIEENLDEVQKCGSNFYARYEVKELDTLRKFLKIHIPDTANFLKLEHSHMIGGMLQFFMMEKFHPISCPMQPETDLSLSENDALLSDVIPYQ